MDDEDKKLLHRLAHVSEQNNRILRRIRREMLWARFFRLGYLIIILIVGVAVYYYVAPYLGNLNSALDVINKYQSYLPH